MLNQGHSVKATCDINAGRGDVVKRGSKGVIVRASSWTPTFTVTFTDQGFFGGKSVTVESVKEDWLERSWH